MKCAACGQPGKQFTMHPSKSRKEFVESLCKKCSKLRKYEDARLEQAKKASKAMPCAYTPNSDEGMES